MKALRPILVAVVAGLAVSLASAWEVTREGWHMAHVGTPVYIVLDYKPGPNEHLESLKVFIDGKLVKEPEIVRSEEASNKDGHEKLTFVFRPEKRGEHRVDLLPVTQRAGEQHMHGGRFYLFVVL